MFDTEVKEWFCSGLLINWMKSLNHISFSGNSPWLSFSAFFSTLVFWDLLILPLVYTPSCSQKINSDEYIPDYNNPLRKHRPVGLNDLVMLSAHWHFSGVRTSCSLSLSRLILRLIFCMSSIFWRTASAVLTDNNDEDSSLKTNERSLKII